MMYFFLVLGIVASIVFVFNRKPDVPLHVTAMKGIASVFFVLTGLFALIENPDCPQYLAVCTVAGAVMGMLGDIALDLKYTYREHSDTHLKLGIAAFMSGHIFYFISVLSVYGASIKHLLIALAFGVALFLGVLVSDKVLKLDYGRLKIVTAFYISSIGLTAGLALSYAIFESTVHSIVFSVAMGLFLISDALLSGLYFGINEKDRKNQVAITLNHVTYYAAQFLIAYSLTLCKG